MTRSPDSGGPPSTKGREPVVGDRERSSSDDKPAGRTVTGWMPSISFLLFALAVIVAGSGMLSWALLRPDPRTVEILLPTPGPLVVHVTGAVSNPGIYTLPPGSRVAEAVDAAGGLTGQSTVNLAALLRDGQQVVVQEINSESAGDVASPGSGLSGDGVNVLLDLNTASAIQLEQLPGIGPTRAAAIIDFRERNGPLLFVDDLTAIDGIGSGTVDALRPLVIQR